jgi:LEA14-like dessication related protein
MSGKPTPITRLTTVVILAAAPLALEGCALFKGQDPLQVTVLGVEPLDSQGLELRMLVKLRVQNPNEAPIDFNGVALELSVQGKTFATGVSDTSGSVPRFGEAVITVPVTASAFHMLGGAFALMQGGSGGKITYEMKGKLNRSGLSSTHFQSQGEFSFPAS